MTVTHVVEHTDLLVEALAEVVVERSNQGVGDYACHVKKISALPGAGAGAAAPAHPFPFLPSTPHPSALTLQHPNIYFSM
jgi:hypothetical protein